MEFPKVLIVSPTNSRKDYCTIDFVNNLRSLTYPEKDFCFCDNSYDPIFHVQEFILRGIDCLYVHPQGKSNTQYICQSFNALRDYFLKGDWEWFLSVECDLFPPADIIETLLAYHKPVVSCRYFLAHGAHSHLLATEFDDSFSLNFNRNIFCLEGFHEYGTRKTKSGNSGLGCILIHRSVIAAIPFRLIDESTHNDTVASLDRDYFGIETTYCDEIITHKNSSWEYIA